MTVRPEARGSEAPLAALVDRARAADRAGDWEAAHTGYQSAFSSLQHGDQTIAADLLRWIGTLYRNRGDLEVATEHYEASLAVARATETAEAIPAALNCMAIVAQLRGSVDEAERLYGQAGELAAQMGDVRLAAMIDQNLGTLANTKGDYKSAVAAYTSALGRFRKLGEDGGAAWALNNLGMVQVDLEDYDSAARSFDDAFDLADRQRDTHLLGTVELNRAELNLKIGQLTDARESCDRAFEIFTRVDARAGIGEAHKLYGIVFRHMGKTGLAENHLRQAIVLAESCENRLLEAESLNEAARIYLASGRNPTALESLNRAHRLFSELRARAELLGIDQRLDRLEATYLEVVKSWGESIESKDRYTAGHCQRVADYTTNLASLLGMESRDLTWLRMAAFLHDVGKTVVPVDVLNKPGKLTASEWEVMKSHTTAGDEIVAKLNFPWDIRPVVRNHHERWDGKGYPDGLRGEEIALSARILCVADVFDALTTARSYRPALPVSQALRIMDRDSGTAFDARIYAAFRETIVPSDTAAHPDTRIIAA